MAALDILLVYNKPVLGSDHADAASEQGVVEAMNAVSWALHARGHRVRTIEADGSATTLSREFSAQPRPDVVFNLCEGLGGVGFGESQVAGIAELCGLSITGSDSQCLALVRDKARTKWLLKGAGLPTADFVLIARDEPPDGRAVASLLARGPVIVKPASEDASLGLSTSSVADSEAQALEQVARVRDRYGDVLVEQFIAGREFNIAIAALPDIRVLPLAEIEFDASLPEAERLVTYDAKWDAGSAADLATAPRCPAQVDAKLAEELRAIALEAFRVTGCRDYARIDVRVGADRRPQILEVNGNPDISPQAGLARALKAAGIAYEDFIEQVVRAAAGRVTPEGGQAAPDTALALEPRAVPAGSLALRPLKTTDIPALVEILAACPVFRADEVAVGEEVLREAAKPGRQDDYHVIVAELDGQAVGWSCHGRVPMTDGTYDLYWIAVDPRRQNTGIGRALLHEIESQLRGAHARWLIAETSASVAYENTRQFYLRSGYDTLSEIPDFYRSADGRVIFGKRLDKL